MDKIIGMVNAKVLVANKQHELIDRYKELKTDQERVISTFNVMLEYDIVPNATGMPKNAKESEKLREQGNKVFIKGALKNMTCINALKLYTKSIAFAPYPSEQLALAYANRSAILFQLGLHSECIQDIDRALALNYPDDLRAKLYMRKTECLMILGNCSVEDILKEAQHWLDKMTLNDANRQKLRSKLDILHCKAVQTEQSVKDNSLCTEVKKSGSEFPLPTIASHNDEVPCASDAVAIKYDTRYGRHVIATRNINPGEVIAVEKLYTLLLVQQNMQTHCSNCLKVCWANIPCNYCTYAMYCSEECRYAEWKRCHDVECAVFPALIEYECYNIDLLSVRLAVLAIREAGGMKELRTMLKKLDEWDDPRTKGFAEDGKLHSDRYFSICSLVTNTEKRSVPDLFRRSLDSCFILYFLATRTVMFGAKLRRYKRFSEKRRRYVFWRPHFKISTNNSHQCSHCMTLAKYFNDIHRLYFTEERNLECVERGIAAMPFYSLINHSCNPNIFSHSRSKHMVIYAMHPIQKGEQLFANYGQQYALMPKATRQQKLLKQYFFTCDCIACQENWPVYFKLQSVKTLVKKAEDKAKIKKALRKFNAYVYIAEEGNVQDKPYIIEDLLKMIQILHKYAPMPCEEMTNVIETLKRIYDLSGNRFQIPKICTYQK